MPIKPHSKYTVQDLLHLNAEEEYATQGAQLRGERASASRRIASVSTADGEAILVSGPSTGTPVSGTVSLYPVASAWDYTALTEAATTDTWVFKTGGSGGSTVATVVITYTDATKATISNVTKT